MSIPAYYWGAGIGGSEQTISTTGGTSNYGLIPEGVYFQYRPSGVGGDKVAHGMPAVGMMQWVEDASGEYDPGHHLLTGKQEWQQGPDWDYISDWGGSVSGMDYAMLAGSHGGSTHNRKLVGYVPNDATFDPARWGYFNDGSPWLRTHGRQRQYDWEDEPMAEYTPRDLEPGEYAALYEKPGGNLGYETFDMGMSPSQYAPQGLKYTLPVPQQAELETGRGVEMRAREIGEQWLRDRNRWSVPGAETGKYRERDDWTPMSTEEVRRKLATWDERTRETWYVGFQKQALQEQAEQQRRYAKYQNELRYSQGLLLKEQAMGNIMSQIVGLGGQERRDIEKGFERKSAEELQAAMGRGMSSSTVLGSISRGLQSEEAEAKGRLEERLRREQAQTQALLVGDITSWIEGRVDEYPSSDQMANIMFGYGASGGGQQAQASGSAGTAAAGGALGCLMSKCCFLFRHARHRDGTEDWVIREYRDNMTTLDQKRGYYKMSEFVCPLMERHRLIRYAVKWLVCDPLVAYGKWFYRNHEYYADKKKGLGHRFGWVFAPLKKFWLKTWKHLGGEFEYIRSNGEVV